MSTTRTQNTEVEIRKKVDPTSTLSNLHSNLEAIFTKFDQDNRGSIVARDLFPILDIFEREQGVELLDSEPKKLLQKFCLKNAELELSPQDLYRLISQLSAPPPSPNTSSSPKTPVRNNRPSTIPRPHTTLGFAHPLSPLSSRQRTTPVTRTLSTRKAAAEVDKRRDAYAAVPTLSDFEGEDSYLFERSVNRNSAKSKFDKASPTKSPKSLRYSRSFMELYGNDILDDSFLGDEKSFEGFGGDDFGINSKDAVSQIGHLSRISLELNKRLHQTEKNLTLSVRQHEERISELQSRVDDMKTELTVKKREIQEYKGNEKAHLQQIVMLESEIVSISRVLSHHKNLYSDLRRQYDEKREETEKIQHLLRLREEELFKSELELEGLAMEQKKYQQERTAFETHVSRLEQEVAFAQTLEQEVEELKDENQHLRDVVDRLRHDLDDAIKGVNKPVNVSFKELEEVSAVESEKNLHFELSSLLDDSASGIFSNSADDDQVLPVLESDHEPNRSYIAFLESQNTLFKTEAKDASQKLQKAVNQLQEAKKASALERQSLQEEIDRLRSNANTSATREAGVQCERQIPSEAQTDEALPSKVGLSTKSQLAGKQLESEADRVLDEESDEFHQNLETEYQKLIGKFNAQELLIQELLSHSDNRDQASGSSTGVLQRVSPPRENPLRRRLDAPASTSKSPKGLDRLDSSDTTLVKTRGSGTVTVILYTLVVYILGILTTMFLQQPMLDQKVERISNANGTTVVWYPEHTTNQQEQQQPRTRPLEYLIYWFQTLAQDDELVQVPT
ncbi:hypothetical protein K493DRAFT_407320 [Basidiobolus meristosporus CBS 931.73]|uniref:EF-hand domain-containing protein n=1 Tax=Basidiobolus meristosporus CBS 931.73 TaxID=1314790 RepID=A0A1Y1YE22_9FUNG|nr:hypothetical protein K493DRAFT_407320 [Basidiobolus meristosporus CBS 931.73]|eukprot:ORX96195.1 hypothetical protein K493DRAFT_407320 [Basidiobolus meristosporus CBS 931.73]